MIECDSSDEEDLRNYIGNIPVKWYDDYDHIGYDLEGNKIQNMNAKKNSEINSFLEKMEDPDYWRKVFDRQSGGTTILTDEQIGKIKAISQNQYPIIGYNPYEPFLDIFSSKKEIYPISNRPEDKRSFIPSIHERKIISKLVYAIKMGWRTKRENEPNELKIYDLWNSEDNKSKSKQELSRIRMHLPAPKIPLPVHAESYNPPPEYIFDEDEQRNWEKTEPEKRRIDFLPQKYDSLRKVPFYENFYKEQIDRCMDLYLAPRKAKKRLNVNPNDLLPDLPNPSDLQPFPTTLSFYMQGHRGQVRSLSIEPEKGELLASGGEDKLVKIWYIPTGRCIKSFIMNAPVTCVSYCPNFEKTLLLVSCESNIVTILNVECGDKLLIAQTKQFLSSLVLDQSINDGLSNWRLSKNFNSAIELELNDNIRNVTWHRKGDYFATVGLNMSAKTVLIHHLSKCASQKPFNKKKDNIQSVLFHPTQPLFLVSTQQNIRIYDLVKHTMCRKLYTGSKFVSCMQLHSQGNNLFVGGLDNVFSWIDLELSNKPWRTLKNHTSAIRSLAVHNRYPLLATVSDDATAIVYHAKVSNDYLHDNELIPVKRLFGHKYKSQKTLNETKKNENEKSANNEYMCSADQLAILSAIFHPTQAWLFTAGADGQIGLFSY